MFVKPPKSAPSLWARGQIKCVRGVGEEICGLTNLVLGLKFSISFCEGCNNHLIIKNKSTPKENTFLKSLVQRLGVLL